MLDTGKKQLFYLGFKGQGHSDLILTHDTLPCPNAYIPMYTKKQNFCTVT